MRIIKVKEERLEEILIFARTHRKLPKEYRTFKLDNKTYIVVLFKKTTGDAK